MESSLIRINEATAEELQQLPQIDSGGAARIVSYREQVAGLDGVRDLASVAGISKTAAREAAQLIDWSVDSRSRWTALLTPLGATVACAGFAWVALRGQNFSQGGPAETLYFTCVALMLLGSLATIGYLFAARNYTRLSGLGWIASSCLAGGLTLLAALLIALWARGGDDDFARHVFATTELAAFVSVILVLIYGPGWHVRNFGQGFDRVARYFDIGQLLLAIGTIALLTLRDQPSLIVILFGIWVGITVLVNSREMIKGRSGYTGSLSRREFARLGFLTRVDCDTPIATGTTVFTRTSGIVLAILGTLLVLEAIVLLVAPFD